MGTLTKPAIDELLAMGCPCGASRFDFSTYVDGRFSLLSGDQFGAVVWAYKGETFVDGVYEIACVACKRTLFSSDACPRCNRANALADVLASQNRLVIPTTCPSCDTETLLYTVMLPAHVVYEGKRAQKARASVDLVEEGAHGIRLDCKVCGVVAEVADRCPLCDAPGPMRDRPD
jgi:hypothetical protein